MNRRTIGAALILVLLGTLLLWQWSRERRIVQCREAGGLWNGPQSRCDVPAGRPIIKRDIERG